MKFSLLRAPLAIAVIVVLSIASRCTNSVQGIETETGKRAIEWTTELVSLGPRPPGSAGIQKARDWMAAKVKELGYTFDNDSFKADTPLGEIEMENLSYMIPGTGHSKRVVLMAHYDSKRFVGFDFTGANDAASSVAVLLALSPRIQESKFPFDVEIVFVDGEEALVRWTHSDSLYGSRHYASRTRSEKSIMAAIVVDMIGDRDLELIQNVASDPKLVGLLRAVLSDLGASDLLESKQSSVEDDHMPLVQAGIPTLHLMDFTYGGPNTPGTYWHTPQDTVDKISSQSLTVVGEIVLGVLKRLN